MRSKRKKHIVTYRNPDITLEEITSALKDVIEEVSTIKTSQKDLRQILNSHVYHDAFGISVVDLTAGEAKALLKKIAVLHVEEDQEISIRKGPEPEASTPKAISDTTSGNSPYTWNILSVKAPEAWEAAEYGQDIKVAIVDTGIAKHENLNIAGGQSCIPGDKSYSDTNGHGTHCAGIVAGLGNPSPEKYGGVKVVGVAPKCNLYAVKVMGTDGIGQVSWVITGMEWCLKNKMNVVNLSLQMAKPPSTPFFRAIQQCQEAGIAVICAAGNSFDSGNFPWVNAPANSKEEKDSSGTPMAVAALEKDNSICDFSSRGARGVAQPWNQVSVSAPGRNILSTSLNNEYTILSGTSMASPHVAGLATLIMKKKKPKSISDLQQQINASSTALGEGKAPNVPYGYGLINCEAALT